MTREELDFIGSMNMCDEISNEAYKKIVCHCERQEPCEDAISRQAVLDMMQMRMSGKELYKAVYELPPVTPKQSRWIPISKRLPESGKEVLAWYEYWSDKRESMVQTFGISFYWNTWCGDVMGIKARCIAWMPLPEPYREDGDTE